MENTRKKIQEVILQYLLEQIYLRLQFKIMF